MDLAVLSVFLTTLFLEEGTAFPRVEETADTTLSQIDSRVKELEGRVMDKAKKVRGEMETKLWGLHDQLESRVKDLARHLETDCRRNSLVYLSDALDEVEKNGMACEFAKTLAGKMRSIEEEARSVILTMRHEAQDVKLKLIPCLNRETATPYCGKTSSLDRLRHHTQAFIARADSYFDGDYEKFLVQCFDKTAFEMKVQAGIVESQKCKGV